MKYYFSFIKPQILSIYITLPMLLFINTMNAQILKPYQWENRIVLILTNDENSKKFQEQLAVFQSDKEGLEDRKLMIGKVTPKQYCLGLDKSNWVQSSELYQDFHSKNKDFEVILIGLDGGVKLRQTEVLSLEKLFSTIDIMPMRRAELRNRKN